MSIKYVWFWWIATFKKIQIVWPIQFFQKLAKNLSFNRGLCFTLFAHNFFLYFWIPAFAGMTDLSAYLTTFIITLGNPASVRSLTGCH